MHCEYYNILVHQEQELLPDVNEGRDSAEKVNELEPVEVHTRTVHSATTEGIDVENDGLTRNLEDSQREITCLTKEISRNYFKMQEGLQKQKQPHSVEWKDSEYTKVVNQ